MKNISKNLLLTPFISMLLVFAPVKADINVVTSIKPLHSLTSYIMEGVGEPGLIIDGVASPHNFQIKPSHAKMLQKADLVIWVGEDLESFLPTALKSIPKNSVIFPLFIFKNNCISSPHKGFLALELCVKSDNFF